ncbi:MAG: DegT/DnrJ/EryC1/StrS family aminotransferase [Candidatus Vogelbacteria bacterium]|nr:DegT/DnrJ/EryC1/StrS family aminotransferase [Candidatus Vogelbacteria bacterium]
MKNAFLNEFETRKELAEFISRSGRLSMGEECFAFEREFAEFQGCKEAVLVNSGGSANLAMLQTLKNLGKLKDGDKVGFSALTWSTNVMPIIQLGMIPVAIDCDPTTLNVMSVQINERLKTTEIKALFLTNVLGFAGDLNVIRDICNERNITLIEDNCEALGSELPEGKCGNFGEMASFSFFIAHHMSTIEGGMVATDNEEYAEMLRIVRANGWDRNLKAHQPQIWRTQSNIRSEFDAKYTFYDLGYNIRPTEITGFIGRFQLPSLKDSIKIRESNYLILEATAKGNSDLIAIRHDNLTLLSSFALPVMCKDPQTRDYYVAQFSGAGVEVRPMIAGNIQNQPFYRKYVNEIYDLPGADKVHECGFYCGNYPELTDADIETLNSCLLRK